jgi:hypothetical protein
MSIEKSLMRPISHWLGVGYTASSRENAECLEERQARLDIGQAVSYTRMNAAPRKRW